jgi:large subunit ribosomal protein L23
MKKETSKKNASSKASAKDASSRDFYSRDPYSIIYSQYVTEKTMTLRSLENANSNRSIARCKSPKEVFLVNPIANKQEIAQAIEAIYSEQKVKVVKVNTINVKSKPRRLRGRAGAKAGFKKAVVTFEPGDRIENV